MSGDSKTKSPLTEEFGAFAKDVLDQWKVPGISIAVVDGDDVFSQGYGFATLPDTSATPDTLWYGASITKAFTAATLAHLIDSKEYPCLSKGWSTPISAIIRDDFILQDAWATEHLTLEDAVCHRTGLGVLDNAEPRVVDGKQMYMKDMVRELRNFPLAAEPRVKYSYSNCMYLVLSHVIETITGKGLGEVMKELIWDPLGMTDTYLDLDQAQAAQNHFAAGYHWDEKDKKFKEVPYVGVIEVSGAGAIISTANDFTKWLKCLLYQTEPFSEGTHKDIRQPRIISRPPKNGKDYTLYGLGWERTVYQGHVMYMHSGAMHAFGSMVWWFPDAKYGVVTFGNTSFTSNASQDVIAFNLIHQKLGITVTKELDPAVKWKEFTELKSLGSEKAIDVLYPNRSDPATSSPLSAEDLAGVYYDPGYKDITLKVESNPEDSSEKILVASRLHMSWPLEFRLHHATGNFWILHINMPANPMDYWAEYHRAEFKIGPDGKPYALEVEWFDRFEKEAEGTTVFKRTA